MNSRGRKAQLLGVHATVYGRPRHMQATRGWDGMAKATSWVRTDRANAGPPYSVRKVSGTLSLKRTSA